MPAAQVVGRAVGRAALTGAHRIGERLGRRGAVPAGPEDLTAEWFTSVLGRDVTRAEVVGGSSATTSRAALRLTLDDGSEERVFVKLTTTYQQRVFLGLIYVLHGEPFFYARVRPLLGGVECPVGLHGATDDASWRSVVVTEDIAATRGAEFLHATMPIGRDEMASLLEALAGVHRALHGHALLGDPVLKTPRDHLANISAFLSMRKACGRGAERMGRAFPAALLPRQDELWSALQRSMDEASSPAGGATLLHGDPHVGNTYRTAAGAMGYLDWQVVQRGSWAYDVSYALSSALAVEDRRAWERELLQHYLQALGPVAPGFDAAWDFYRRNLIYPLHCWTCVYGAPSWMPETQPEDASRLIIERVATAIDDLDALAAF